MFGGTGTRVNMFGGTAQAQGLICLAAQHKHKD